MTATDDSLTMHPVIESVMIRRVLKGEVVESELLVGFTPAPPGGRALLAIGEGWMSRKQCFKHFATYEVGEVPMGDGRQFVLHRDPEAVERERQREGTAAPFYFVTYLRSGQVECDCFGKAATERIGHECKHAATVRHLLATGNL